MAFSSLKHGGGEGEVIAAEPGAEIEVAVSAPGWEAESLFAVGVVAAGTVEQGRG
jgi:hypothetical protein